MHIDNIAGGEDVKMISRRSIQLLKFVILVSLYAILLIVIFWPQEQGYHFYLLNEFPAFFQILLYSTVVVIISVIALGVLTKQKGIAFFGMGAYLSWMLLFYIIPASRGYYYGTTGGDTPFHLSVVRTIVGTGTVPEGIFYPIIHILISISVLVGKLPIPFLNILSAPYFRICYMLGAYILVRRYWGWQGGAVVFLSAIPFVFGKFHATIHPFFLSFSLLPLFLFLLDKRLDTDSQSPQAITTILIVLSILFPLFHPLNAVLLLIVLLTYSAGLLLYHRREGYTTAGWGVIPVIFSVIIVTWVLFNGNLGYLAVGSLFSNFVSQGPVTSSAGGEESIVAIFVTAFTTTQISISEVVFDILIEEYGAPLMYLVSGGFALVHIAYRIYIQKVNRFEYAVAVSFMGGGMLAASLILIYVIIANPIRASRIAVFFSIFMIGVFLYRSLHNHHHVTYCVAVAIVAVVAIISIGMVYSPGYHTSTTDMEGIEWSVDYLSQDMPVESFIDRKSTYYILGYSQARDRQVLFSDTPPRNIGYKDIDRVGKRVDQELYIVITERDTVRHLDVSEERAISYNWLVTAENRKRLSSDPSASQIYDSGQYRVWEVPY